MSLILFSFACVGLTQILVYGKILDPVRPSVGWLSTLLSCPMCTGFWVGVFLWAISGFTELFIFDRSLVTGFVLGCYSSFVSYVGNMLVCDEGLQIKTNYKGAKNETNYKNTMDA